MPKTSMLNARQAWEYLSCSPLQVPMPPHSEKSSCESDTKDLIRNQLIIAILTNKHHRFLHSVSICISHCYVSADGLECYLLVKSRVLSALQTVVCNVLQKKSLRLIDIPGHDRVRQKYFDKFKSTARYA